MAAIVIIDPVKVAELFRSPQGPVYRRLAMDAQIVKEEARRLAPVYSPPDGYSAGSRTRKPGTLRDSIVVRVASVGGEPRWYVGSSDPVALFVHEGTQPHVIQPRRKPLLVFFSTREARVVYAKSVNHPGTKPNRFLLKALAVLKGRYV